MRVTLLRPSGEVAVAWVLKALYVTTQFLVHVLQTSKRH